MAHQKIGFPQFHVRELREETDVHTKNMLKIKKSLRWEILRRSVSAAAPPFQQTVFSCHRPHPQQNKNHVRQNRGSGPPGRPSHFHGSYICRGSYLQTGQGKRHLLEKYSHNGQCLQRSAPLKHNLQGRGHNFGNRCVSLQQFGSKTERWHRDEIAGRDQWFAKEHIFSLAAHER